MYRVERPAPIRVKNPISTCPRSFSTAVLCEVPISLAYADEVIGPRFSRYQESSTTAWSVSRSSLISSAVRTNQTTDCCS
mgnify:CR=1 FL=1